MTPFVGIKPTLLNRIDDQHAQCRADAGDPVDELDMDIGAVAGAFRKGGGIYEEEEAERELEKPSADQA